MSFPPNYVCVHVFDQETKKFLLIRRTSPFLHGMWQMVTGSLNLNETADEAAQRELREETSLVPCELYRADMVEVFYDLKTHKISCSVVYLAYVSSLLDKVILSSEHDDCKWLSFPKYVRELTFLEQKKSAQHVYKNFCTAKSIAPIFRLELPLTDRNSNP